MYGKKFTKLGSLHLQIVWQKPVMVYSLYKQAEACGNSFIFNSLREYSLH